MAKRMKPSRPAGVLLQLIAIPTGLWGLFMSLQVINGRIGMLIFGLSICFFAAWLLSMGGRAAR